MKIQFCFNCFGGSYNGGNDIIAEFDVAGAPTEEQCGAIDEYIMNELDKWAAENDDDFSDFDYWDVCCSAARKYLMLVDNPVVKTFYV